MKDGDDVKMLNVAYYTFLRSIRDVKSMLEMVISPIILILILGTALNSVFEVSNIGKTAVAYVNYDEGEISSHFEKFLAIDEIDSMLEVQNVESYEEGLKLVNEGKVRTFIFIDKDYSQQLMSGNSVQIKLYEDKQNVFRTNIVSSVVDSFISGANTHYAKTMIGANLDEMSRKEVIEQIPLSAAGNIPRAMDYYTVTMLVFFMMYGALYAVYGIGEDYIDIMRSRLLSTPVGITKQLVGKIVGLVGVVFVQGLVLIAFTGLVYQSNWGNNLLEVLFITLSLAIFAVGMGTLGVIICRDKKVANTVLSTLIPVMTFLSGGYLVIVSDNAIYNAVRSILPSHLMHTAYFNSIYGEFAGQTVSSLAILWIMIGLMFVGTVVAGRRRFN